MEPYPNTHSASSSDVESGARGIIPASWSLGVRVVVDVDVSSIEFGAFVRAPEPRRVVARRALVFRPERALDDADDGNDRAPSTTAHMRAAGRVVRSRSATTTDATGPLVNPKY